MKKISFKKLSLLLISLSCLTGQSWAALSCQDVVNNSFSGTLGSLSDVTLTLDQEDVVHGIISFTDSEGQRLYGALAGQCTVNKDGSLALHLVQDIYSTNVTVDGKMVTPGQLSVEFNFSDPYDSGSGSGTLSSTSSRVPFTHVAVIHTPAPFKK